MKFLQFMALTVLTMLSLSGAAIAQDSALAGVRLGFAIDRGFGVIGSVKQYNIFIGNDGFAADYLFRKETVKTELKGPVYWYVGGGGYADWDGDLAIRLPVGAEWHFVKELDTFAEIIPDLRVNHNARFGVAAAIGIRYQF